MYAVGNWVHKVWQQYMVNSHLPIFPSSSVNIRASSQYVRIILSEKEEEDKEAGKEDRRRRRRSKETERKTLKSRMQVA
jgi:HSP20 family molecular chaperone IbpA